MLEGWELLYDSVLSEAAVRLGIALFCGFLLGAEREIKEKPAGLRTIILITVGATIFMIVSDLIAQVTEGPEAITRVDPSRIAAQVVTGIGFLGAGAIIQARGAIHGLTTAAAVWVAAGIGLCVGVGFPLLGIGITLLVLLVLVVLDPLSTWLNRHGDEETLRLVLSNDTLVLQRVRAILKSNSIPESRLTLQSRTPDHLKLSVSYRSREGKHRLLEELATVDGVRGDAVSA
jgi:putative Mg2+ transporter-C (MgtC) family protein